MKRRFMRSFRYGEKGFTLIELLIVIAILGVISAAVIPNVARFTQSGKKAAAMQEMETVQVAIDAAMADAAMTSVTGTPTVGPGTPTSTSWPIIDGAGANNYVGDFLRRDVDGQWTVDTDGLILSGDYKNAESPAWNYASGNWTWG